MAAQYVVQSGRKELPPLHSWQDALMVAKDLAKCSKQAVSIVNLDAIDVCMGEDCTECNRDGLTAEEREQLEEAGIG